MHYVWGRGLGREAASGVLAFFDFEVLEGLLGVDLGEATSGESGAGNLSCESVPGCFSSLTLRS